jgi:exosortase/archaeosortase family protein
MPASILVGSLLVSLAIYFGFLGSSLVDQVAAWTATWTSIGLNSIGFSTTVSGTILASDTFAVNIVAECTAVGPLVLFIGAVAAYPSSLKSKGLGLLMGLVVLTGVNVIRIMSLFWIGGAYPQYLDVAHLLVWQSVIILLAIVLWLFWVDRMAGARNV